MSQDGNTFTEREELDEEMVRITNLIMDKVDADIWILTGSADVVVETVDIAISAVELAEQAFSAYKAKLLNLRQRVQADNEASLVKRPCITTFPNGGDICVLALRAFCIEIRNTEGHLIHNEEVTEAFGGEARDVNIGHFSLRQEYEAKAWYLDSPEIKAKTTGYG